MSETTETMCWQCGKRPIAFRDETLCFECYREIQFQTNVETDLPKAKDTIAALSRLANDAAGREALKRALESEHRTNQQLVCRAVVHLLEKWADDARKGPGWYDARNEASVKFAEAVMTKVPEKLRYFPYL